MTTREEDPEYPGIEPVDVPIVVDHPVNGLMTIAPSQPKMINFSEYQRTASEGDSEDVGHLLVHVFLLRIAARLHPVDDDMDLFTVERPFFGSNVLRVASSTNEFKTPWILSTYRDYFECDRKSHGGTSSTNRCMVVPWISTEVDHLDRVKQAAEVFQQYMLDTMDPPTKAAGKE